MTLGAATVAFVAVPTLGPVLAGTTEGTERYDTVITPPGYAFSIWAPIFLSCMASTIDAIRPCRVASVDSRAVGWPLAGAYALNTVWSVATQTNNFQCTPVLLPAAVAVTAVAYRRLQTSSSLPNGLVPTSTGLLLGWTGLAATVNLCASTQLRGASPTSNKSVVLSTLAVAGSAATLVRLISGSQRGHLPLAAASAWGLATTALNAKRPRVTRLAAGVAATAILRAAAGRSVRLKEHLPTSNPRR